MGVFCDDLSIDGIAQGPADDVARKVLEVMGETSEVPSGRRFVRRYRSVLDRGVGDFVTLFGDIEYSESKDGGGNVHTTVRIQVVSESPHPSSDGLGPFAEFLRAAEVLGAVQGNCRATFFYILDEYLVSKIVLPSPLLGPIGYDPYTFTHVESVVLSGRDEEGKRHSVDVFLDDDFLAHTVSYSFKDGTLTSVGIQGIRHIAEQISESLLEFRNDPNEGDDGRA